MLKCLLTEKGGGEREGARKDKFEEVGQGRRASVWTEAFCVYHTAGGPVQKGAWGRGMVRAG